MHCTTIQYETRNETSEILLLLGANVVTVLFLLLNCGITF